jgi:hypothetical protein
VFSKKEKSGPTAGKKMQAIGKTCHKKRAQPTAGQKKSTANCRHRKRAQPTAGTESLQSEGFPPPYERGV